MNYRLTIYPDMDTSHGAYRMFLFETRAECVAAKDTVADMLIYMQDELSLMDDYSNMFIMEEKEENDIDWEVFD